VLRLLPTFGYHHPVAQQWQRVGVESCLVIGCNHCGCLLEAGSASSFKEIFLSADSKFSTISAGFVYIRVHRFFDGFPSFYIGFLFAEDFLSAIETYGY